KEMSTNALNEFRVYELTQAIEGMSLKNVFTAIHQNLNLNNSNNSNSNVSDNNKLPLQRSFIYFAKQMIDFILTLEKAGLCYTDLKLENILVQLSTGTIKISDIKSLLKINELVVDKGGLYEAPLDLYVTHGYASTNLKNCAVQNGNRANF